MTGLNETMNLFSDPWEICENMPSLLSKMLAVLNTACEVALHALISERDFQRMSYFLAN